jgi:hypothetical protein
MYLSNGEWPAMQQEPQPQNDVSAVFFSAILNGGGTVLGTAIVTGFLQWLAQWFSEPPRRRPTRRVSRARIARRNRC